MQKYIQFQYVDLIQWCLLLCAINSKISQYKFQCLFSFYVYFTSLYKINTNLQHVHSEVKHSYVNASLNKIQQYLTFSNLSPLTDKEQNTWIYIFIIMRTLFHNYFWAAINNLHVPYKNAASIICKMHYHTLYLINLFFSFRQLFPGEHFNSS